MIKRLVLIFHGVGKRHRWANSDESEYWCDEEIFLSLIDSISDIAAIKETPIEITFDDGNISDIEIAAPALAKRGLVATFFVCAGRLGQPGYLDAGHLQSLVRGGMSIGSHGCDHIDWRNIVGTDLLHREITVARDLLQEINPTKQIDSVAIPFGSYDRHVRRAAAKVFSTIYTSDGGLTGALTGIVPRECYTRKWSKLTLLKVAAPRPLLSSARRSIAMAYKFNRGSPGRTTLNPGIHSAE